MWMGTGVCALLLVVVWIGLEHRIRSKRLYNFFGIVVWLLAISIWSSPIYYEFPDDKGGGKLVTFVGENLVPRPYGFFCWEWNCEYALLPQKPTSVTGTAHPVTPNPKVRDISYHLRAEVVDPMRFFRDPQRRKIRNMEDQDYWGTSYGDILARTNWPGSGMHREIGKTVTYHLYEFNERYSKELGEFYNPLDAGQYGKLQNLLEPWLNKRLLAADGIRVTFTGFSVK